MSDFQRWSDLDELVREFFDDFVEAFRSFDGAKIAERYLSPYTAFHSPESVQVFVTSSETAGYFQQIVDEYHLRGCRSCSYKDLEIHRLGRDCAVATVTWSLLTEDLSLLSSWRESYNLCRVERKLKVFISTDHAVSSER